MRTLVIYDADPDGFGCAYAAWKYFDKHAEYLEVRHGQDAPIISPNVTNIYVFDRSFPLDQLKAMGVHGASVTVIDHHSSAKEMLDNSGFAPYPVDTTRAACVQVWEYFHETEPPLLLQYVADRDTWTWALPYSDAINTYLFTLPTSFWSWQTAADLLKEDFYQAARYGTVLLRYRDKLVDCIVQNTRQESMWIDEHLNKYGYIPTCCAPILQSEVGHKLLVMYPEAPFSATYVEEPDGHVRWSMRSEDHRADVGAIAKSLGGGGHHNAAGYRV